MKRHKNLERAIVLGLMLSTSISGTVFAVENDPNLREGIESSNYEKYNKEYNSFTVTVDDSAEDAIMFEGNVNLDFTVKTSDGDITLNSKSGNGIYVETIDNGNNKGTPTGSINLNSSSNNKIIVGKNGAHGINNAGNMSINLTADGSNIIENISKNEDNGDGINLGNNNKEGGNIYFTANKNELSVMSDGIYTDKSSNGNVQLNAKSESNEITAGNNGIDHRGSGTITLEADKGANIIKAGVSKVLGNAVGKDENKDGIFGNNGYREDINGDGIRTENSTGTVKVEAGTYNQIDVRDTGLYIKNSKNGSKIDLIANGTIDGTFGNSIYAQENGVQINSNNENDVINVDAKQYGNSIIAEKNAVYNNGTGTITITAMKDNLLIAKGNEVTGYSTKETEFKGNGVVSTNEGLTEVIANNGNNTIFGTSNGILANAGEINVTANNGNNTIGQYTDTDGTYTSEIGINASNDTTVSVTAKNNNIYGTKYGIRTEAGNSAVIVEATNGNNTTNVTGFYDEKGNLLDNSGDGINVTKDSTGKIELTANNGNNIINVVDDGIYVEADSSKDITLTATNNEITVGNNGIDHRGTGTVKLTATNGDNTIVKNDDYIKIPRVNEGASNHGVKNQGSGTISLSANNNTVNVADYAVYNVDNGSITLEATNDNNLTGSDSNNGSGIVSGTKGKETTGITKVTAGNNNTIAGGHNGIETYGGTVEVTATNGQNSISGVNYGIYNKGTVNVTAKDDNVISSSNGNGINTEAGTVEVTSINGQNSIYGMETGLFANASNISLKAKGNTLLAGNRNEQGFGDGHAIKASGESIVNLAAIYGDNNVYGVIYAKDTGTEVNLKSKTGSNIILSSAHGSSDGVGDRTKVVAAVYAQNNGVVNITAGTNGYNYIATDATLTADEDREQTVWAQQGGKINIDGQTTIIASNVNNNTDIAETTTEQDGNSLGIAITAGTGKVDGLNITDIADENRSTVNITNASGSSITGDIVSGYGGLINIGMDVNNKTRAAGTIENINITGNALAANGGKLNINLGNNGKWTGRADDYGDAGLNGADGEAHQKFYNPAFSNEIKEGGTVNLTMGDNSTWKVQGQSWITSVDTTNAQNATIDLVEANTNRNTTSHALTIYDLKGNANINMSLDGNRDISDMLYIKNADGEYNIALADAVTTADMYANELDGLRFATVGVGSNVKFNAGSYDAGVFNVEYEVGTDAYDGNDENVVYNGDSLDVQKPGSNNVDGFFEYQGEDPNAEENTSEIATYAKVAKAPEVMALAGEPATETTATTKEAIATGATNYKLIARKGESLSDAGKTILNMSKANYSQAVYMDTLNKRLGEARYLEGDEGLWIRMRHDKIDKDSSYEITNNMYELGYDKKYESKDKQGYHRRGVAIDYMDGDTSYDDIAGGGETNRKGIWLYDTWIGNKGHYTDYVAKWGHLENSFDLYTKTRGEKVSGEYNNNVYSLSAEWGYKDPLKNGWYFEPQTQLQYARVTGADYETSQGTQVSVDGIDSLIARAGFRLGKDFGEEKKSTFYVKADILHEFLGDQDISVLDKTTDGKITSIGYDNDGTWYSVGLGFSTMLSDNSYAFLDVEKIFGNDNDNSYQINGGFNWLL